eukprot:scaffold5380_cov131-Cylindrotheca_fusiformis.AAC.31
MNPSVRKLPVTARSFFFFIIVIATLSWAYVLLASLGKQSWIGVDDAQAFNRPECVRSASISTSADPVSNVSSILKALDPKEKWAWPDIDVVYTWVDGSKPEWLQQKEKYRVEFFAALENKTVEQIKHEDKIAGLDQGPNQANRYKDHQELRYSMRSIVKNAPWIRNIYLLTADGEGPDWLDASHPKIKIVSHKDTFDNPAHLPTFSSRPIEANLPNIPGISDYALYSNDDMFFGLPVHPSDWLPDPTSGSQTVYLDFWHYGDCHEGCTYNMLGDGQCNEECKNAACNWDMGDCGIDVMVQGRKDLLEEQKKANYTRNSGFFMEANMYTDGIYNRELGKSKLLNKKRGPIAHIPYLINMRLYRDLQQRFKAEYEKTKTHRFRHVEDFQLSFAYFHYYAFQQVYAPTKKMIWRAALLTTKNKEPFLFGNHFDKTNQYQLGRRHFIESTASFQELQDCSQELIRTRTLSDERIAICEQAVEKLYSEYQLRLPVVNMSVIDLKHGNDLYYFQRIVDGRKVRKWKRRLEEPADKPRKFVCLEDMLLNGSNPEIEAKYLETFNRLFPDPSPFEK